VVWCVLSLIVKMASATDTCADNGDKAASSATNSIIQGRVDLLAGVELKVHPDSDVAKTGRGEWIVWPDRRCRQEDLEALVKKMPNNTRAVIHGHPERGGLCFFIMEGTREGVWQKLAMHRWNSTPIVETDTALYFDAQEVAQESDQLQSDDSPWNWGLDRIDQRKKNQIDNIFKPMSKTGGNGVDVYVIDTGIRTSHEEFEGRAKPKLETFEGVPKDCTNTKDRDCAADTHGHGTFCAAIVGGRKSGVAKKATLHAVKVHDGTSGTSKNLHVAFDWLLSRNLPTASTILSVSLSLGSPSSKVFSIRSAIEEANDRGINAVLAAGNHGELGYYSCWPGHTAAIIVVAMDRQDKGWEDNAKIYDIYAPGVRVRSAWIRWGNLGLSDTASGTFDGTSAAAPHVAGAAALLLAEANSKGKAFPHGAVKKTLMKYASKFEPVRFHFKPVLYIGDDPEVDWMSEAEEAPQPEERSGSNTIRPPVSWEKDQDVHLVLR